MGKPFIPMLKENNVRTGFFEHEQFEAVRSHLHVDPQPVTTFDYITGWRRTEVLNLQWPQVDFNAGFVRLEPGTTKNDEARVFPFTEELRSLLEAQKAKTDSIKKQGIICPYACFIETGKRLSTFVDLGRAPANRLAFLVVSFMTSEGQLSATLYALVFLNVWQCGCPGIRREVSSFIITSFRKEIYSRQRGSWTRCKIKFHNVTLTAYSSERTQKQAEGGRFKIMSLFFIWLPKRSSLFVFSKTSKIHPKQKP
jgi:hypothetical protein